MDYQALKTLVQTHPTWESETSVDLAAWCNAEVVSQDVESLPVRTIYETIFDNAEEWTALSADRKQEVWNILFLCVNEGVPTENGNPFRERLIWIFGPTSDTVTALAAKLTRMVSRAAAAGIIQTVTPGDVEFALTL